jgi:membrane-associated phospholipid phosphatase
MHAPSIVEETVESARHELTHRTSQARSWRFEVGLLVLVALAGVLTWLARTVAYFPIDVELTRSLQGIDSPWIETVLRSVAWIGFPPQSNFIFGTVIVLLFLVGFRWEAAMTLFAAAGSAGLWFALAPLVDRPRPSPELVRVAMELPTGGFPSGHVLNLTAIFGFLIYLTLVLTRDIRWRSLLVALLSIPILLVGVARVYDGAHWPSDVLGGYLIGGIWLGLTIWIYRWLEAQSFAKTKAHRRST